MHLKIEAYFQKGHINSTQALFAILLINSHYQTISKFTRSLEARGFLWQEWHKGKPLPTETFREAPQHFLWIWPPFQALMFHSWVLDLNYRLSWKRACPEDMSLRGLCSGKATMTKVSWKFCLGRRNWNKPFGREEGKGRGLAPWVKPVLDSPTVTCWPTSEDCHEYQMRH